MNFKSLVNKNEINDSIYHILGLSLKSEYIYDVTKDLESLKEHFSNTKHVIYNDIDNIKLNNYLKESGIHYVLELVQSKEFYDFYKRRNVIFKGMNVSFFLSLVSDSKIFSFFFIKDIDLTFCLIQKYYNLAVWFPSLNIYIPLQVIDHEIHINMISEFVNTIFQSLVKINNIRNLKQIDNIKVLLAYNRPYHYFMAFLKSYFFMRGAGIIDNDIIYLKEKDFFKVEDDDIEEQVLSNEVSLNNYLLDNKCLILYPIKDFVNKKLTIDDYHRWVNEKSLIHNTRFPNITPDTFILWIGICAEKRNWLEMEDGAKAIIENFSKRKEKLCVILDGLTRQESIPRDAFINNVGNKDFDLVESILRRYPNISFINSVGFTAKEKIFLAQKVDFFVTNFLTDSMYVARFAKKLGVAYGANVATLKDHMHPKTFILPTRYVKDLRSDEGKNWSLVGYSIDPKLIASFCQKVEEGYEKVPAVKKMFTGEDFLVNIIDNNECYKIEPLKATPTYIGINEEFYGFSKVKNSAYSIEKNEKYHFRYEALSETSSRLYILAYIDGKRVFTEKVKPNSSKIVSFPNGANKFRLFIRLSGSDTVVFYNIFWNTSISSNCAWLSVR